MHLLDAGVVNEAGIGAGASDDELGPEQLGRHLQLVVVYESCCNLWRNREGDRLRRGKKWRMNMSILEGEYGSGGTRGDEKNTCQIS